MNTLADGLHLVAKRDCQTCTMLEPVYDEIAQKNIPLHVYSQDDPQFPDSIDSVVDDRTLEISYRLNIETVPTLLRVEKGREVSRVVGWNRDEWKTFLGCDHLGEDLPAHRPGCGALNVGPGMPEKLAARFGDAQLSSRRIELGSLEDDIEAAYDRGWSDGLPLVPPTEERVVRMLSGTKRPANEIIGVIPPDLVECTIEKVAINAVMAGCKPEYLPVVIASVEAACMDEFCMHGLLATTWFSGPVVIVNGPIAQRIGMNCKGNALGQGNRANATIGRALQLIIRNVGGGRPRGVDRATLGNPGKYTFCFAEDEDSNWESLAVQRGYTAEQSTVSLFAGDGVQGIFDQLSRTPESLAKSMAECLKTVAHPKIVLTSDVFLVVSPEHYRVFNDAGWSKERLIGELSALLIRSGKDLIRGAQGIAEGIPEHLAEADLPKFREGGLNVVRAGGGAGLFSAIIGGWLASGAMGSSSVTKEIIE